MNIIIIIIILILLYLVYTYWYIPNNSKIESFNLTKKLKTLSNDYTLTEATQSHLDKVFNEFILEKQNNNTKVFFDISYNNKYAGRIIIELFDDVVPYTVKNFIHMVQNNYVGSKFHRIIKNFVIQGGDYINNDGSGSTSIYNNGNKFDDENFNLNHDSKYLLSMANSGPNTNGCQFFITLNPLPNLDGKHVVFGRVIEEESQNLIDNLGNIETDDNDMPINECIISDAGLLN
jgi:cyclophilin family peptidyl-prolyl cis-trans isomerase